MTKTLSPPQATKVGGRIFSLVGMWQTVISRRTWWRSGPGDVIDVDRVHAWLRIQDAFSKDVNGPWKLQENDLGMLAQAARCIGDELAGMDPTAFHYLMIVIAAIDSALLGPADAAVPETEVPANETESAAAE